ncbi:Hypothetical predicted protein [Olea europaea subsp. europaea]|uniref:Lipoprotein n=1 Tax=Olea europaea subsp. europaea TaxID=158383 RepID=A0A8S0QAV7_OLEEU|nr:Hypothetical predicted protein [Olea europaea subsp. europaea]
MRSTLQRKFGNGGLGFFSLQMVVVSCGSGGASGCRVVVGGDARTGGANGGSGVGIGGGWLDVQLVSVVRLG